MDKFQMKRRPKDPGERVKIQTSFSALPESIDVSKTYWPELRKPVLYEQQGNKSKLAKIFAGREHVLKEGIRPGSEVKESDDIGSMTSKSDIASSVFVEQSDMSVTPLQATSYSSKVKEYSSAEERMCNNSSSAVELEKSYSKNICQFHITSGKPLASAGSLNHTTESERYTSYGNVCGVACKKEKVHSNLLATAEPCKTFCGVSGNRLDSTFKLLQKGENLPQPQLKEEQIISGNIKISSNQLRSNQRKRTLKEEKKQVREEEARKRMLAPKGQRVRLVSQKMLEAMMNSDAESMSFSTYQRAAPAMNEKEFPTMEESRMQRIKLKDEHSCGVQSNDSQRRSPSCEVQLKLKNMGNDSDCINSSSAEGQVTVPTSSLSVRNKKRKDPIQIDLVNLIKTQPAKCNKSQGENGGVLKVNRWVQKKESPNQYCGNQLDASNPERKRGKKKEVPKKKKNSVLKSVILEERAVRQQLQVLRKQGQSVDIQSVSSQEQGDVTVHSNAHAVTNDSSVKQAVGNKNFLCVAETVPFGEVTSCNVKKAESPNSTEILDLTQYLRENLSLMTNVQVETLEQNVSAGPETAQDMIQKTEVGEGNCTLALSGSPSHSCTDVLQRFSIHSRRFREYCDNSLTVPLTSSVKLLIKDIVKFQDRQYHRDPVKAFARRRYVLGFREVMKYLQLKKLKLIIIAPDLEVSKLKGGIYDRVAQLKEQCTAQGVTYLFALSRRELGILTFKNVGISIMGIFRYEGSENNFKNVVESLAGARTHYQQITQQTITVVRTVLLLYSWTTVAICRYRKALFYLGQTSKT
ncbi:hypothetical protein B7P43_G08341 [Cryptotermes secundus]|uniref:Ribosomal protein eL8/eL30/eS12/Gadd45 domain-containing protein n=1 Tax=Cryptotermes secundus TaxID=105785 RepID=A0A2J7PEJ6_9NEOP|nr:hypothetical protein B7P43_G08341 [Cryptotermes secundus]